eukprot:3622550-Amphidinium_carterae.1
MLVAESSQCKFLSNRLHYHPPTLNHRTKPNNSVRNKQPNSSYVRQITAQNAAEIGLSDITILTISNFKSVLE